MLQSAGDGRPGIPVPNEVSAPENRASDEQLLGAILRDEVAGPSGPDKARALIAANGDLAQVLRMEPHQLTRVVLLSNQDMSLLDILRRAIALGSGKEVSTRPVIGSLSALEVYLQSSLSSNLNYNRRVLFLNQFNQLQVDVIFDTYFNSNPVTAVRDLVMVALEYGASAAIVVQRRIKAKDSFETALVNQAKIVERSLQAVGIVLHDYVHESERGCASMRASGFLSLLT